MSLDLMAVHRDADLLDALSQRAWVDGLGSAPDQGCDPAVGLLAALVADVDEDLPAATDTTVLIPRQVGRARRPGTVLVLPLPLPPTGRRHVARALAAAAVVVAMLSVSGVAVAVSGDPLTPYKRVIDVVRVGYHDVVPKGGNLLRQSTAVAPRKATAKAARAGRAVVPATDAALASASRRADQVADHRAWQGRSGRHVWNRQFWGHHDRDGRQRDGYIGSDFRHRGYPSGQHRTGHHGSGGSGHDGDGRYGGRDTGEHWGQPGDSRR